MRIAVLTDTDRVHVEFPPEVFRQMLKTYLQQHNGDVDKALDQIEAELRKLTITA